MNRAEDFFYDMTSELSDRRGAYMQRYDRLGGLLWMAIGTAICVESVRLGTGSVSAQVRSDSPRMRLAALLAGIGPFTPS